MTPVRAFFFFFFLEVGPADRIRYLDCSLHCTEPPEVLIGSGNFGEVISENMILWVKLYGEGSREGGREAISSGHAGTQIRAGRRASEDFYALSFCHIKQKLEAKTGREQKIRSDLDQV